MPKTSGWSASPLDRRTGGMTSDALHLTAVITYEGEWHVARCLQVEVASQGETTGESLENLREALELYFEDLLPSQPPNRSPFSADERRDV